MMPSPRKQSPLWLLVLITVSGTMAMHMFVPALPVAAGDLGATAGQAQMTISFYVMGLAVGQLFYGPLSDSFGRRPLLMFGLGLYALGGLVAALAPEIHVLVGARLAEALGGCAGLALGRAIVRDSSRADEIIKKLALLNLMMMIGPGLSPLAGSVIAGAFGWRAIFWLLAGIGVLTLLLAWKFLPETSKPCGKFSASVLVGDYRTLLGSRQFACLAIGGGCATTSIYAFIATAPFLFHTQLHRPLEEVGIYLGMLVFGMSLGNMMTGRLAARIKADRLMRGGNLLSVAGALAFLALVMSHSQSVFAILAAMLLFTCGVGIASPAALARAVSFNPHLTGSAAGLYGFTQMLVGAVCTSLVSIGRDPVFAAAIVLVGAMLISQFAFWLAMSGRIATAARRFAD
jgi:DHA1 family bicyclomycin/chloramphenicol resistance-like MFS transporter